nr:hypothetical protein [uncultured Kingella sp.]
MELAGAEFVMGDATCAALANTLCNTPNNVSGCLSLFTRLIRQPETLSRSPNLQNTIFRLPFAKRKNTRYIAPREF